VDCLTTRDSRVGCAIAIWGGLCKHLPGAAASLSEIKEPAKGAGYFQLKARLAGKFGCWHATRRESVP
jgi:hypothetical protein